MPTIYFETVKPDKDGKHRRYKVLGFGPGTVDGKPCDNTVTLQGSSKPFTEVFDKERFKKMGYRLVKEEEE